MAKGGREQEVDLILGHRSAEQIALTLIAAERLQEGGGVQVFDPFRRDRQAQAAGQADNRANDAHCFNIPRHRLNK